MDQTLYFVFFGGTLLICVVAAMMWRAPERACLACGRDTPLNGRACRHCGYKPEKA